MKILVNDIIQNSDAPDALKSPALSDVFDVNEALTINFDGEKPIDCIGLGNTDGTYFTFNNTVAYDLSARLAAVPIGETSFGLIVDSPWLVTGGGPSDVSFEVISHNGQNALLVSTVQGWAGFDLVHAGFDFRAGNVIRIEGEWVGPTAGQPLLNLDNSGWNPLGGWNPVLNPGDTFEQTFTLTENDANAIAANNPAVIRVRANRDARFIITRLAVARDVNILFDSEKIENGLYLLPARVNASQITITTDATYIGRLGAGLAMQIGTSVRKEPSFNSTATSRTTLSGQVAPGLGGHIFMAVSLDGKYKIDGAMMNEIKEGYRYIGMGYPFFINFEDEAYKLPFDRMYAIDRNQAQMGFESGVARFLYSRRFEFEERF